MRPFARVSAAVAAGLIGAVIATTAAKAAEVVLITTGAVEQIMLGIIPAFERTTGHKVSMSVFGTGPAVAKLKEGASVDLVLLAPEVLRDLAKDGKVDAGSITDAFRSRIGAAVRAGAPKPDISTAAGFRQALLDAKSIAHSIGPSGEHFSRHVIAALGIADQVRPKIIVTRGQPVALAVAKGEAELAIHQIAELMPVPGVDILGPLPDEFQTAIVYATGLHSAAKQPEAARALVKLIADETSVPVIRRNGMDPAR